ncbi:hypothetical protein DAI22_02g168700 [Oryza sativa Japonica Group]|nr:hypothetical protein DAI22_02g168700 [Oryza sativa Japonica Group]KAF2944798.1 hypothetical protein DAI22_02g168700 [Oryza sativa Japonica Group]
MIVMTHNLDLQLTVSIFSSRNIGDTPYYGRSSVESKPCSVEGSRLRGSGRFGRPAHSTGLPAP